MHLHADDPCANAGSTSSFSSLSVAFGPKNPGWGSWEWIGQHLCESLSRTFATQTFARDSLPECEIAIVVKHSLPPRIWRKLDRKTQVIYCPVDRYGSVSEIEADRSWLSRCDRIVIHCERLRKYFASYSKVEYIDHHVNFVAPAGNFGNPHGPILWVGDRDNLLPLMNWLGRHQLPRELIILTNTKSRGSPASLLKYGFPRLPAVRVEQWSRSRHLELLTEASAAIDVKGNDFRQRHKPPAKAIDFIASGLPLAMNADSSATEYLAQMGFSVPVPDDTKRWFSPEYRHDSQQFGTSLRERLSRERIASRFAALIMQVWKETSP